MMKQGKSKIQRGNQEKTAKNVLTYEEIKEKEYLPQKIKKKCKIL